MSRRQGASAVQATGGAAVCPGAGTGGEYRGSPGCPSGPGSLALETEGPGLERPKRHKAGGRMGRAELCMPPSKCGGPRAASHSEQGTCRPCSLGQEQKPRRSAWRGSPAKLSEHAESSAAALAPARLDSGLAWEGEAQAGSSTGALALGPAAADLEWDGIGDS